MINKIKFAFFGSSEFSVFCLEELKIQNLLPSLIITVPDKPVGRGLKLEANPVKIWAEENNINYLIPNNLNDLDFILNLTANTYNLFLIASYGKIIPKNIIDLPEYKTLNIHPSLLPKYRGASPLQAQILDNQKEIGISIMQIDELMDHGPIISQKIITIPDWPVKFDELEKITAVAGIKLFSEILSDWIEDKIKAVDQNHTVATFTKKTEKKDGELDIINGDPYKNYLKYLAFSTWPGTYFFIQKNEHKIRVIVKDAEFKDNQLIIKLVLPEGKKEMNYNDFLRGLRTTP